MYRNTLKELWAAGRPALNGWLSIGDPFTAEIMAAQGYDSLTIDMQHGALDYSALLPMIQAIRASGVVPMARVPWLDPAAIMKALDAGAVGIICPMINTRAQAEEFVSYMRYPPRGQRSFGPTRVGVAIPGYGPPMNEHVLAFAMIETADGVANLDAIASVPGLDGLYVGPADLTLGTQNGRLPPGFDRDEPEMVEILKRIAQAGTDNGIVPALHCGSVAYAQQAIRWGYRLTTVGSDARFMATAASGSVASWREALGRADEGVSGEAGGYA